MTPAFRTVLKPLLILLMAAILWQLHRKAPYLYTWVYSYEQQVDLYSKERDPNRRAALIGGVRRALRSAEPVIQTRAIDALVFVEGPPERLAYLAEALENSHESIRQRAAEYVGLYGGSAMLPIVMAKLASPKPEVRAAALRALSFSGPSAEVDTIREIIKSTEDPSAEVRLAAVRAPYRLYKPDPSQFKERSVRYEWGLAYVPPQTPIAQNAAMDPALIEALAKRLSDSSPDVRCSAIDTLELFELPQTVVDAVMPSIADESPLVRAAATRLITARSGSTQETSAYLSSLLSDPRSDVRTRATVALASLDGDSAALEAPLLQALRSERDLSARRSVALGLSRLEQLSTPTVLELLSAARDPDADFRRTVRSTLYAVYPMPLEALPAVEALARDPDSETRALAGVLYPHFDLPGLPVVQSIQKLLATADAELLPQLLHALSRAKDPQARDMLRQHMKDPNPMTQRQAAIAFYLASGFSISKADWESLTPVARALFIGPHRQLGNPNGNILPRDWASQSQYAEAALARRKLKEARSADPIKRALAIRLLVYERGYADVILTFVKHLDEDDAGVREAAYDGFASSVMPQEFLPLALQKAASSDVIAARGAMRMLGRFQRDGDRVIPVLRQAIQSSDNSTRFNALTSLQWFPQEPDSVRKDILADVLPLIENDLDCRHMAINVVRQLRLTGALPTLKRLAPRWPPTSRQAAEVAILELESKKE